MRVISYIFILLIVLLGLTFAILNAKLVVLNYYVGTLTVSLSLLLVFTLVIGVLLGLLVSLAPIFRLKRENSNLKGRVRAAEQEISNLRVIPIKDSH